MNDMMDSIQTPSFIFHTDVFARQIRRVKQKLGNIPLTYSIKANAFLLAKLPDEITHVEVCSPGELQICKKMEIPGSRIIYSGVNKEWEDVSDALRYGADLVTAESLKHLRLAQEAARQLGCQQKVLLRLTSGNQFGMSMEDIAEAFSGDYPNLVFWGIHYYSGTQKKARQMTKDIKRLDQCLEELSVRFGFVPQLVEYGPGFPIAYFADNTDVDPLDEIAPALQELAARYPLGIEMGRYFASDCGIYATKVVDIKRNDDVNYVILDGGIHHLRYYGQMMAMQVPEMEVRNTLPGEAEYCLCGSLCTVADVLVRNVKLPTLQEGSVILFQKCGAYAVTDGNSLFLSRKLPAVYLTDDTGTVVCKRALNETFCLNC